jgi:endonuclease/exonuclease/phosphatase family metal-dependent hydrolase
MAAAAAAAAAGEGEGAAWARIRSLSEEDVSECAAATGLDRRTVRRARDHGGQRSTAETRDAILSWVETRRRPAPAPRAPPPPAPRAPPPPAPRAPPPPAPRAPPPPAPPEEKGEASEAASAPGDELLASLSDARIAECARETGLDERTVRRARDSGGRRSRAESKAKILAWLAAQPPPLLEPEPEPAPARPPPPPRPPAAALGAESARVRVRLAVFNADATKHELFPVYLRHMNGELRAGAKTPGRNGHAAVAFYVDEVLRAGGADVRALELLAVSEVGSSRLRDALRAFGLESEFEWFSVERVVRRRETREERRDGVLAGFRAGDWLQSVPAKLDRDGRYLALTLRHRRAALSLLFVVVHSKTRKLERDADKHEPLLRLLKSELPRVDACVVAGDFNTEAGELARIVDAALPDGFRALCARGIDNILVTRGVREVGAVRELPHQHPTQAQPLFSHAPLFVELELSAAPPRAPRVPASARAQ